MAGAGYKLFNTGDVLTAAQVNTYLMEQTVMVFADAAARTTALTGVVSEGMISYLKDTNAVEVYNGSAWVASDDPNAIQNTIVDAKGDLITATAADTPSRLAVGNSGDTLVADSSATTGLRWQGNYAAGKNAIINGDFNINQRNFSSTTTSNTYGHDRWQGAWSGGTVTYSNQTFTLGTAPVSGYEAKQYARIVTSGQSAAGDLALFYQPVESVRTFAGQTVTYSFWAKASSGTPKIALELQQFFGQGGSPSATVNTYITQITLSTSWQRYSATFTVPSISGKTIGTNNFDSIQMLMWTSAGSTYNSRTGSLGIQNTTIDIWGVQLEAGSVATAFQTATGTLAGELAACQRYLPAVSGASGAGVGSYIGYAYGANAAIYSIQLPVPARVAPTGITVSGTFQAFAGNTAYTVTPAFNQSSPNVCSVTAAPTITSGNGSRLELQATSLILFTGCEL